MNALEIEALPQGWAQWELDPIDSTGRHSVEELMLSKGRLTAQFVAKKLLEREAGSRIRTRVLTAAVHGGFGLMNRREYESLFASTYTEDCELTFEAYFPDMTSGVRHGSDAFKQYMDTFGDAYESMTFQPRSIVDPGGARYACAVEVTAVGRTTGISITQLAGTVLTLEAGRAREQQIYRDWPTAVEHLKRKAGAPTP